jgi:hypothetical protein
MCSGCRGARRLRRWRLPTSRDKAGRAAARAAAIASASGRQAHRPAIRSTAAGSAAARPAPSRAASICAQLRARMDAELVGEIAVGVLEPAQRLGLLARPVQRQHQLAGQPLIGRCGPRPPGQLGHQRVVLAEPQPHIGQRQHRASPFPIQGIAHPVQPPAAQPGQGRPVRQPERNPQQRWRLLVAGGGRPRGQRPEPDDRMGERTVPRADGRRRYGARHLRPVGAIFGQPGGLRERGRAAHRGGQRSDRPLAGIGCRAPVRRRASPC